MWWSKKETVPANTAKPETFLKKHAKKATRNRNRPELSDADVLNTAETNSGFEVHFVKKEREKIMNQDRRSDKSSGTRETRMSNDKVPIADRLLSIDNLMAGRRKVHRSQYSIHSWNASSTGGISSMPEHTAVESFVPRPHRVPLSGTHANRNSQNNETMTMKPIQDSLSLLQRYDMSSELHCLEEEIKLLDAEIAALKQDRADMDRHCRHLSVDPVDTSNQNAHVPHRLLLQAGTSNALSLEEKNQLQAQRGLCLTLRLTNEKCREFLLSKCGFKTSFFAQFVPSSTKSSSLPITLSKQNCNEEFPAASIQHISLLSDDSVFVSLDHAKSYHHGRLPERLYRRLQPDQNMNQLLYVATGPLGCYYAEFRSGKAIWGLASDTSEGDEFATLCRDWNVSRVAFGPVCTIQDNHGIPHQAASWVILSRDGQAAWKNVPSRLHRLLEDRLASQAAPIEVSLGYGDSYFIRFLDGTVDYCLPAHIVSVMESLNNDVVSISLHPELPYDFVLRHR